MNFRDLHALERSRHVRGERAQERLVMLIEALASALENGDGVPFGIDDWRGLAARRFVKRESNALGVDDRGGFLRYDLAELVEIDDRAERFRELQESVESARSLVAVDTGSHGFPRGWIVCHSNPLSPSSAASRHLLPRYRRGEGTHD